MERWECENNGIRDSNGWISDEVMLLLETAWAEYILLCVVLLYRGFERVKFINVKIKRFFLMDWSEVVIVTVMINDVLLLWINNSELWFMNLWEKFWSSLSHFFMIKKESCNVSRFWFMDLCEINFDFFFFCKSNIQNRSCIIWMLNIVIVLSNCNFLIQFKILICKHL